MISQKYMQGANEIIIESAESIDDAKKNKFKEGEYSRYFVNGKAVPNYMLLIKFIVGETLKNKSNLIPDEKRLEEMRKQMIDNQKAEIRKVLDSIKSQYVAQGVPESVLDELETMIDKVDETGLRVIK